MGWDLWCRGGVWGWQKERKSGIKGVKMRGEGVKVGKKVDNLKKNCLLCIVKLCKIHLNYFRVF